MAGGGYDQQGPVLQLSYIHTYIHTRICIYMYIGAQMTPAIETMHKEVR